MFKIPLTEKVKKELKPALWGNAQKQIFSEIRRGNASVFLTKNKSMLVVARMEAGEFVVVAVVGKDLLNNRQEIIDLARASRAKIIRFHTRNPEHLKKGLRGLRAVLFAQRPRTFGRDEYIYKVSV